MSAPSISLRARLLLLAIILPLAPSLSVAQQAPLSVSVVDQARAHFQKGVDYYVDGDLAGALSEFQRAYALQPTYRLLYNFGQVAFEQRDYAAAERYFRSYLKDGGDDVDAQRREEVERDLERLKGRVAELRVHASVAGAKVFIDDQAIDPAALAQSIRVSAGRRSVRAESDGYAPVTRVIDVVGGETLTVELVLTKRMDAPPPAATRNESASTNPALWTGIATGVLAVGTGAMAYWASREDGKYADALHTRTTRAELDSLADRAKRKAFITDVMLGATIVTAAVTVFLLLSDDEPTERAKPSTASIDIGVACVHATF